VHDHTWRAADVHPFSLSEALRPAAEGDDPVMAVTAGDRPPRVTRTVQAGVYRSEDGREGLCLVNCDDSPHAVTVRFPAEADQVFALTSPDAEPKSMAREAETQTALTPNDQATEFLEDGLNVS